MTEYQLANLRYNKKALQALLGYRSLSSVYRLLEITCLPKKSYYSYAELTHLKISKALLIQKKSGTEIQQYWAEYLAQKSVNQS